MGPIGVKKHLTPFLPNNSNSLGRISSSNYASASILTISYGYLAMLGFEFTKKSTAYAILNANYLMKRL
ncbi:MAG: hypothetical protein ACK52J_05760 [bacterium]|jgi:glycine dehydrogenase